MTEGLITAWLAREGDAVVAGEPLFEMETDKLTITVDSTVSGTLLKIIAPEGASVPIAETIAFVGAPGEGVAELTRSAAGAGSRVLISPRAKRLAAESDFDWRKLTGSAPGGMIVERDVRAATDAAANRGAAAPSGVRKTTSPVLVGSEAEAGRETGHNAGRAAADREDSAPSGAWPAHVPPSAPPSKDIIPLSGMRKAIAERVTRSLSVSAQATCRITVCMDEARRFRASLAERGKPVSYNDIIVFSVVRALRDFPAMNAELTDGGIWRKDFVNLGVAVALRDGLAVPVLKDAHLMTLGGISAAIKNLAQKAADNRLTPDDCSGGSFTVSNLGMYGLDDFTAILNPPESGALAVGKIADAPVAEDGKIVIRAIMALTLTYDHRVIDGAPAAMFLSRVKEYLENPYLML